MYNSSNSSLKYLAFGILEQEDARFVDRCYFLYIYIYILLEKLDWEDFDFIVKF